MRSPDAGAVDDFGENPEIKYLGTSMRVWVSAPKRRVSDTAKNLAIVKNVGESMTPLIHVVW